MSEHLLYRLPNPEPVESYRSAIFSGDPLIYPGERPTFSYLTDGRMVNGLTVELNHDDLRFTLDGQEGLVDLDDYLAQRGLPTVGERIPILAYGANLSPSALVTKFGKIGRDDGLVVPTIYGWLQGFDVVWSAGPGVRGNFIANLYKGSETADTEIQVGINLLTREQLLTLNSTEGSYDLNRVELDVAGVKLPAYYYAGIDEVYLDNGRPLAVSSIIAKQRSLETANTSAMLTKLLSNQAVIDRVKEERSDFPAEPITPRQYIDYVMGLTTSTNEKSPRTNVKRVIHAAVTENGLSKRINTEGVNIASWANPSSLQTIDDWRKGGNTDKLYVLPSTELDKSKWDPDTRQAILSGIASHTRRSRQRAQNQ